MPLVWIPSELRELSRGAQMVQVDGNNLGQVINNLDVLYPGVQDALLVAGGGSIQPTIAVAIDGETTHLGLIEPVRGDSEIHFIHAIGGG